MNRHLAQPRTLETSNTLSQESTTRHPHSNLRTPEETSFADCTIVVGEYALLRLSRTVTEPLTGFIRLRRAGMPEETLVRRHNLNVQLVTQQSRVSDLS